MVAPFEYVFPAIRGIQAGREYFVSMCPLRLVPRIFLFDEEELVPELRAQRILNRTRIPELARYVVSNRDDYVFSAITASIDGDVRFEAAVQHDEGGRIGSLRVPMSARFIINDGQHRRAAVEVAMRDHPDLADETIAVVFFLDKGLQRCQQMFADLNRYAIRPSKSLGVLYDHRDAAAQLAKLVVFGSPLFRDVVEMEKSTLAPRSRKLFTLSAIYSATLELVAHWPEGELAETARVAASYWDAVAEHIPEWRQVRDRAMTAGEVRQTFIHSHATVLQALGRVGNSLLAAGPKGGWRPRLKKLQTIDWSRSNTKLWEGRAMTAGRVSKGGQNVTLTANAIKKRLGIALSPDERRVESAFARGEYADAN